MRLRSKVAIVTGAGSGFGEAIAKRYAEEGARVVVNDIAEAGAQRVAADIRSRGGEAAVSVADVSRDADVARLVRSALEAFAGLDIVVNNAGTTHRNRPMLEVEEQEFDRIFAVNVKSIFLFAHAAVPAFRRKGRGVILNIGSTAGLRPRPGLAWYNASKGAGNLLSQSMAVELAPDKIRVCALAPVAGDTALLPTFLGTDSPEMRANFISTIPLGRLSTPQDIANAALFRP